MQQSTVDAMNAFRTFPVDERQALFVSMIRDFVARDGRDKTIRLLLENLFIQQNAQSDPKAETLAAFARLPEEAAAAVLTTLDPKSVRIEDCLSDSEVERIVSGAEN
jgi:hypothetical protein